MALHKARLQPWGCAHVFCDTHKAERKEFTGSFPEEMDPRLSLLQRPGFQLMSEGAELCSCQKILKFGHRGWHTAHDLVATDTGEHDAIPLRG